MGVQVKKGRHRRFEEARALKRLTEEDAEPCAECGAEPGADHATWCLAMEDLEEEEYQLIKMIGTTVFRIDFSVISVIM